jgi:hypothetical protein
MADSCFIPLVIRHGTKAQLIARGSLLPGELGWTSDEDMVYVGDGSSYHLVGRALSSSGNPVGNGVSGQLYVNTATSGIFFSNGSGWIPVGANSLVDLAGTLDDIRDGVLYQRVAASEVDASGFVLQINDGSHTVTASQARDHIDDVTIHRSINDAGSASTDLWSAQKIMDTLGATVRGISWQDPVKDKDLCSAPVGPADKDRYIVCVTASGSWAGYAGYVTEYLTASGGWVFNAPTEGWAAWVEDEDRLYLYNGVSWAPMSSVTYHDYLAGLSGNGPQYYHLNASEFNALTSNLSSTVQHIAGPMVSGTQTHITVSYDEPTGLINFVVAMSHSDLSGIGANDHHNQSHGLVGGDHTVTTVSGHVLRAISSSAVEMGPITNDMLPIIQHNSLAGIGPNDHHNQQHNFFGGDHSFGLTMVSGYLIGATSSSSIGVYNLLDGGTF